MVILGIQHKIWHSEKVEFSWNNVKGREKPHGVEPERFDTFFVNGDQRSKILEPSKKYNHIRWNQLIKVKCFIEDRFRQKVKEKKVWVPVLIIIFCPSPLPPASSYSVLHPLYIIIVPLHSPTFTPSALVKCMCKVIKKYYHSFKRPNWKRISRYGRPICSTSDLFFKGKRKSGSDSWDGMIEL